MIKNAFSTLKLKHVIEKVRQFYKLIIIRFAKKIIKR